MIKLIRRKKPNGSVPKIRKSHFALVNPRNLDPEKFKPHLKGQKWMESRGFKLDEHSHESVR